MALPSDEVLSIWNRIMKYQVDFSFPLELPVYLNLDSWCSAERVLDLGSGDGYYASRLATFFREKSYTCIDIDQRAIEIGKNRTDHHAQYHIAYEIADALQYTGSFPIAIARLLVQHLETPEVLFLAAPNFLQEGGTLIVIDSDDQSRLFWPAEDCRWIEKFFASFSTFQPAREHCTTMIELAGDYGFELKKHQKLLIPSCIPTYKNIFYKSYQLVFEVVRKHYGMEFDYESLSHELGEWVQSPDTYAQIGVNVCAYQLLAQNSK